MLGRSMCPKNRFRGLTERLILIEYLFIYTSAMFSTFASNILTILEVSHETQQNQNSYEWSERMPSLEKKYGAAPSTTYSGGIALRGFCVGLDGGLFHSFDPAEGTNSIGLYGSLQHSANIPASALLFQDKSLSEFTMGDFGTRGSIHQSHQCRGWS